MPTKKQVKEAIKTRIDGETLVGTRVYIDRIGPLQDDQLPAIVVFVSSESVTVVDNLTDRVALKIAIEIQVSETKGSTDFDTISDQVYHTLRNHEYLGDLVEKFRYSAGELYHDERRHVEGAAWVMTYDCSYLVDSTPDLEVANPADLELIFAEHQGGQAPDPEDNPIVGSAIEIEQD